MLVEGVTPKVNNQPPPCSSGWGARARGVTGNPQRQDDSEILRFFLLDTLFPLKNLKKNWDHLQFELGF